MIRVHAVFDNDEVKPAIPPTLHCLHVSLCHSVLTGCSSNDLNGSLLGPPLLPRARGHALGHGARRGHQGDDARGEGHLTRHLLLRSADVVRPPRPGVLDPRSCHGAPAFTSFTSFTCSFTHLPTPGPITASMLSTPLPSFGSGGCRFHGKGFMTDAVCCALVINNQVSTRSLLFEL